MLELYEPYNPKGQTLALIRYIRAIISQYQAEGLRLTLRQLYYQLVSRDVIRNEERQYKRIGTIVSRARRGGMLDWDAIEDRIRQPVSPPEFNDIRELVEAAIRTYRLPRMQGQKIYVELWVEKDALAGVLRPIANSFHVTLMVNRGYSSTSAMKEAGERIRKACEQLRVAAAIVLYLGDLDPSGEDMVRDVGERLNDYVNSGLRIQIEDSPRRVVVENEEQFRARLAPIYVEVEKLALTMEQVEEHDPPPNPAKMSDSRARKFVEEHGEYSWEVDALPPTVLRDLIEDRLAFLIDDNLVHEIRARERHDVQRLREAVSQLMED